MNEFTDNVKKKITGTKNPKKGRLPLAIIICALFFLIGNISGFFLNNWLEQVTAKADVDIIMPESIENDYLPITIMNNGEKSLTNITVNVSSCDMVNRTLQYHLQDLEPNQVGIIKLIDEKTIENFDKLDCVNFNINQSEYGIWMDVYKTQSGKIIIPKQESLIDVCGFCYYDIIISTTEIKKSFREHTYSTIQFIFSTDGQNPEMLVINLTYIPIKFTYFDKWHWNRLWDLS